MPRSLETMPIPAQLSRVLLSLFLVTVCCSYNVAFAQLSPDSEKSAFAYRSRTSEVRLVLFASDENNHSVQDLQKDDFAVVDDGRVIRDFRSFTHPVLTKLDVVVLVDTSDSVVTNFHQEIAGVLQLISQSPWTPEDNVSLLSFSGTEVRSICAGDCPRFFTIDQAASLPSGGATPLFDAMEVAISSLIERQQPQVWPVIILFSDGDDTISKSSFDGMAENLVASGVQVYAIDVGSAGQSSNGMAMLQRIADDTGGRYFRSGDAVKIFNDVMDDLNSARVVTYVAPESGPDFHSIRILPTHNLNLRFRCRRGYHRSSSSVQAQ
jgi:VWFA-related protein